ncbi:MAG: hypothetical protein K8R90_07085 [Candidatus Cloacimonetes bacterium]|nr:hypothetical protein [Candidatus Cloacimonadota bacterium]
MGQQQILLIVVGVIIVGIAISVGFTMYRDSMKINNHDAVIKDVHYLAWTAMQFYLRTGHLNGWDGEYPADVDILDLAPGWPGGQNDNGVYAVIWQSVDIIVITGSSTHFDDINKQVTMNRTMIGQIIDQP